MTVILSYIRNVEKQAVDAEKSDWFNIPAFPDLSVSKIRIALINRDAFWLLSLLSKQHLFERTLLLTWVVVRWWWSRRASGRLYVSQSDCASRMSLMSRIDGLKRSECRHKARTINSLTHSAGKALAQRELFDSLSVSPESWIAFKCCSTIIWQDSRFSTLLNKCVWPTFRNWSASESWHWYRTSGRVQTPYSWLSFRRPFTEAILFRL
jgi:hypothetical protein